MTTPSANQELTITRTFAAPPELVFQAWTDPALVAQWWGPKQFTNPVCEVDARAGGAILIHMLGPDGVTYPMRGSFQEVEPPRRLVFTSTAFEHETGNFLLENVTTVTFAAQDGATEVTMHTKVTAATAEAAGALSGMEEGWNQSLDKLAGYLETT